MCEKPFICLLLIWYVLGPLKTFISAFVRNCVCAEMRVSERREGGGNSRAVDLYHFCCCFYSFLFFSLLYVQYSYFGFVTKLTSSAVTRIEVSSG